MSDPRALLESYAVSDNPGCRLRFQIREAAAPAAFAAVRAVLELHKPIGAALEWCGYCVDDREEPADWPCPTVQAITKALADS